MASFRCYDNFDIIATLITTNFHLYLIQLWWQFFQMFVYGDVVYAQTWQVLTLKNCIEPFSYASTAYVVASALVSARLFCKNLSNLQTFFGQMVYCPPWQKPSRTPMVNNSPLLSLSSGWHHIAESFTVLKVSFAFIYFSCIEWFITWPVSFGRKPTKLDGTLKKLKRKNASLAVFLTPV